MGCTKGLPFGTALRHRRYVIVLFQNLQTPPATTFTTLLSSQSSFLLLLTPPEYGGLVENLLLQPYYQEGVASRNPRKKKYMKTARS